MAILLHPNTFQALAPFRPETLQRAAGQVVPTLMIIRDYAAHISGGPQFVPTQVSWHLGDGKWGWLWFGPLVVESDQESWTREIRLHGCVPHALRKLKNSPPELAFLRGEDSYGGARDAEVLEEIYSREVGGYELAWLRRADVG